MSYSVSNTLPANPATGSLNSQTVNLWDGSRFSPVNTPPATNGSPPSGSADFGPYTTNNSSDGFWTFTVDDATEEYVVSTYDSTDTSNSGTYNTYWLGPYLINVSTNQQGWVAAHSYNTATRSLQTTTIAAGSGGAVLPQATINVVSTAGFPTSGVLPIGGLVSYTGLSGGNTFTGCSGGSGTLTLGQLVYSNYTNGDYRRLVIVSATCTVFAVNDAATIQSIGIMGGAAINGSRVGHLLWKSAVEDVLNTALTFPVDPLGTYSVYGFASGTGTVVADRWIEVDF